MNNDQLWNYLLTPSGIIVSMIITFGLVGIYAYLMSNLRIERHNIALAKH